MPDTGGDDYPDYGIIYPGDSDALTRLIRPNFAIDLSLPDLIQSPFPSSSLEAGSLDPVTIIDLYSEDTVKFVPAAVSGGLLGLDGSTMSIKPNAGRVISGGYLMTANVMPNASDWSVSLTLSYEVNDATQTIGSVSAIVSRFGSLAIVKDDGSFLASATVSVPLKESVLTLAWDGKDRLRASWNGVSAIASIDGLPSLYGAIPSLTVAGNVAKSFTGSVTEGLTNQSPSGSSRGALYGQIVIDGESVMWPIGDSVAPRSDSDGVFNTQTQSWAGTSLEAAKTALANESIPSLATIAYCPAAFAAAPSESVDVGNWTSIEEPPYGGDALAGTSDLTPGAISVDFGPDILGFQGIYKPYPTEPSRKLVGLKLKDVTIETVSADPMEYLGDFVDGHDSSAFLVPFLAGSDFSADGGGLSLLFDDLTNDSMSIAGVQLSNADEMGLTVIGCRLLGVDVQSSVSISEIQLKVLAIDIEGAEVSGTSTITGDGSADWDASVSLASTELVSTDPADPVDIELLWGSASANAVVISCYGLPLEDPVPATPAVVVTPDSITITAIEWLYEVAPFKLDFVLADIEGNGVPGSSSVSTGNANWVESPNYAIATLDSSNTVIPVCDIDFSINNPNDGVRTAAIIAYADPPHPISVSFSSAVWLFSSSNVALPEAGSVVDFASEVAQISANFSEVIFWKDSGLTSGAYDVQNFENYVSIFEAITSDSSWNPSTTELHGPNVHLKARGSIYDTTYSTSDASPYSFTVDSRDMDFLMDFIEAGQAATPTVGYSSVAFSAEFETAEEWIGLLRYVKESLNTGVRIIVSTIFDENVKIVNVKEIVDTFNEELTGFDVAFISGGVSSPIYAIRSGDGTAGPMEDGVPSDTDGYTGDFYIDTDAIELYGPKGLSTWGNPLSLDFPSLTKSVEAPVDLDTLWFKSNTFVNYLDLAILPDGPVPYETNGYGIEDPSAIISATYLSDDATPVAGSISIINGSLAVTGPSSQLFPTGGKLFFKTLDFADHDNGEIRLYVGLGDIVTGTTFGDTIMSLSIGNYYLNNPIVNPLSGINQYDNLTLSLSIVDTTTTRVSIHCNESTSATPTDFLDTYDIDRIVGSGDVLSIVSDGSSVFSVELNGELIIDASGWGYSGIINDLNKVSVGLHKAASTSYFATIRSVYVLQGPHIDVVPQSLMEHNGVDWTPLPELSYLGRSEFYNPVPSFGSYAWEFRAYLESPKVLENARLKIMSYSEDIMYNGIVHISNGDDYEQSFEFSEPGKIGYLGDLPIDLVTGKGSYTITMYGDSMKSGVGFLRMSIAADNMSSIVVSDNIYIKENNG